MELEGKHTLVVGLRRSGAAAAKFLAERGASVTVTDTGDPAGFEAERKTLAGLYVKYVLGRHDLDDFLNADLVVVSPGVPMTIEFLSRARAKGIEIIGELELASRFIDVPMIGVTGTNGKSTVTELTGEMLRASGRRVFVGGNIGNPLVNLVDSTETADVAVVELSSFQLEGIVDFHPRVGVMLNITPDHLDRYAGMREYINAKARLWMNMTANDWAVVNSADEEVLKTVEGRPVGKFSFRLGERPSKPPRAWLDGQKIMIEREGGIEKINASGIKIAGSHNLENALACAAASIVMGATPDGIQKALEAFEGLPHRTRFVRELDGVKYYNDSKGTNVGAVLKSLAGFDRPVVLIAGGLDKAGDFSLLRDLVAERVKALVLIGKATDKIEKALGDLKPVYRASNMSDAVGKSAEIAESGDVVLLSPACASFDMFRDYTHRGDEFEKAVTEL